MQKNTLNSFISKYSLGGKVNSVKWESNGKSLKTSFITPDKNLLGEVRVDKISFEKSKLGIYETDKLQKLLSVLGDDISLDLNKFDDKAVSMKIKNGKISIDYQLSDLAVISDPPALKKVPAFNTKINIDSNFITTYIKGKSALSDADTFSVVPKGDDLFIIINYSTLNTNRVNIPVKTEECEIKDVVSFDADIFKEILVANRECKSAVLEVSNEGLARINFSVGDYESTYYIVASQGVN